MAMDLGVMGLGHHALIRLMSESGAFPSTSRLVMVASDAMRLGSIAKDIQVFLHIFFALSNARVIHSITVETGFPKVIHVFCLF